MMNCVEHRCAFCLLPAPDGEEFCGDNCREMTRDWEESTVIYPVAEKPQLELVP